MCAKELVLDWKDARSLAMFVTDRSKIIPRRISGNCAKHQRELTIAVKRARRCPICVGSVVVFSVICFFDVCVYGGVCRCPGFGGRT
jgi:ribosomal protein S18